MFAKADKKTITRHEPKITSAPARKIPAGMAAPAAKKKSPWLWVGIGVVVAGLAAAAGGGGSSDTGPTTGDITLEW